MNPCTQFDIGDDVSILGEHNIQFMSWDVDTFACFYLDNNLTLNEKHVLKILYAGMRCNHNPPLMDHMS